MRKDDIVKITRLLRADIVERVPVIADGLRRSGWPDSAADVEEMGAEITRLRAVLKGCSDRVERLESALHEIESFRERTVFSAFREHENGNKAFMLGANTAFVEAADVALDALAPEDEP